MPRLGQGTELVRLAGASPELWPLYVPASLIRHDAGGQPAGACVPVSYQLARALRYLGYEASLLVVCASVFSRDNANVKVTDVGVWDREPSWHGNGPRVFNGHVVVYSGSFERLVDVTIGQDMTLHTASERNPEVTRPLIIRLPHLNAVPTTLRGKFLISYHLFPAWTHTLDPYWQNLDTMARLERGALGLAHDAVNALRVLEDEFPESRVPPGPARELLDGRTSLPEFVRDLTAWREQAGVDVARWSRSILYAAPSARNPKETSVVGWLRQGWNHMRRKPSGRAE
jgi:hypothetical protein